MKGPLGETHGKGGRPELPAVQPLTVADLDSRLSDLAGGRARSILLSYSRGYWTARIEYAGGGFDAGREAIGYGHDAETATRAALALLPRVGHA